MRMRYLYEIATRDDRGRWVTVVSRRDNFTRDAQATARSLLERWINDRLGQLPGGQVFVLSRPRHTEPKGIVATVRIRVYRSTSKDDDPPLAVAYLGSYQSDDTTGAGAWLRRRLGRDRRPQDAVTRQGNGGAAA